MTRRKVPQTPAEKKWGTWFFCETCGGLEVESVKDHLVQKHGLAADTKGAQKMTMHLDERNAFHGLDELRYGDVVLTREYHQRRGKDSAMRW